MDWNEDEDVQFQTYTMTVFTFIYARSPVFEAEHDDVGDNAAITGSENLHNRATPRSSPNKSLS